jgi:hypothetical protein
MVKFWIKILPNYFYKKITDQEFTITYYCLVGYLKLEAQWAEPVSLTFHSANKNKIHVSNTYMAYIVYFYIPRNRTSGVMVCMLDSSAVDCGFKPCSGQNRL